MPVCLRGVYIFFLREKGNNISSTTARELILEERTRDAVYAPVCGSFIKTCWPIIFINQPVSPLTTPGGARQHTHAFMNVHTDKRKYADRTESCCWLLHHRFTAQNQTHIVKLMRNIIRQIQGRDKEMCLLLIDVIKLNLQQWNHIITSSLSRLISGKVLHEIRNLAQI